MAGSVCLVDIPCSDITIKPQYSGARGRGGGNLIFSYILRLRSFFGFKMLNFNIFGSFQKNKYFWGYEDFVEFFLRSSQIWTIFRGHFNAF